MRFIESTNPENLEPVLDTQSYHQVKFSGLALQLGLEEQAFLCPMLNMDLLRVLVQTSRPFVCLSSCVVYQHPLIWRLHPLKLWPN